MRVSAIVLFLIFNLTSFGQTKYPDHYKTEIFEGVLFGKADNVFVKTNSANPRRKEVYEAELLLSDKIESIQYQFNRNSRVGVEITKKYSDYKRQYFAYFNSKGQRILIISFYFSPGEFVENGWSMRPKVADDGWDNYWSIRFNTVTRQFFAFQVNSLGG